MIRRINHLLFASAAPAALMIASPTTAAALQDQPTDPAAQASAQTAPAIADDEEAVAGDIVVTAQRREERLQDVPISISAFSQDTLTDSGVRSMEDLVAVTPGLIIQRSGAGNTPFIRGVGSNSANGGTESPVTTYVDGVYMPSLYATGTSLLNIERVEVLKGPQGTLFGRNSTGGVVQVITRDPSHEPGAELRFTVGNYETLEGGAYLTGGIAPNLAANLTVFVRNQGKGYGTNIQTGNKTNFRNESTFMGKVKYDDGTTSVTLAGDYSWFNDPRGFQRVPFPGTTGRGTPGGPPALTPVNYYDVNHGQDAFVRTKAYGGSITIEHGFEPFDVTSISAVRQSNSDLWFDNDFGYANLNASRITFFDNDISQEVRVASAGEGPFSWIFGAFFLSAQGGNKTQIFVPAPSNLATYIAGTVHTTSIAGFGEAAYQITPNDKVTVGARYTIDHRETSGQLGATLTAPGTLPREATWRDPTWRLVYDHKFTDDIMAYGSYNRGFKSGNFNVLPATTPAFNPEYIDAFEVGFKSQLFDRKVRFNASAYYYDYKDLQVNATTQFATTTVNAASARIKGFDFDFNARPIRNLSIDLGGSFLDAKYVDFPNAQSYRPNPAPTFGYSVIPGGRDASGRDLLRTPDVTLTGGISYTVPSSVGDFTASARANHTSGFNYEIFHLSYQEAYTLLNLGLAWESPNRQWNARLDVTNATGEEYAISGNVTDTASYYVAGTPRLVLFTVGTKF